MQITEYFVHISESENRISTYARGLKLCGFQCFNPINFLVKHLKNELPSKYLHFKEHRKHVQFSTVTKDDAYLPWACNIVQVLFVIFSNLKNMEVPQKYIYIYIYVYINLYVIYRYL